MLSVGSSSTGCVANSRFSPSAMGQVNLLCAEFLKTTGSGCAGDVAFKNCALNTGVETTKTWSRTKQRPTSSEFGSGLTRITRS